MAIAKYRKAVEGLLQKKKGNHNADEPALPMLQAGRAGTKLKNLVSGFYESPGLKI
jgi:hypothetical protein